MAHIFASRVSGSIAFTKSEQALGRIPDDASIAERNMTILALMGDNETAIIVETLGQTRERGVAAVDQHVVRRTCEASTILPGAGDLFGCFKISEVRVECGETTGEHLLSCRRGIIGEESGRLFEGECSSGSYDVQTDAASNAGKATVDARYAQNPAEFATVEQNIVRPL